jgi:hypothetical protein
MNFATLKTLPVNQSIPVFMTVVEVGGVKLTANNKRKQSVKLRDDNGEQHTVSIFTDKSGDIMGGALNQRLAFSLSRWDNQGQPAFSGFWNSTATVNQQPHPAQQAAPPVQTYVPPQQTYVPANQPFQSKPIDNNLSIIRQCMAKAAVESLKNCQDSTVNDIINMAEILTTWCLTGDKPVDPNEPQGEPSESEMPFGN